MTLFIQKKKRMKKKGKENFRIQFIIRLFSLVFSPFDSIFLFVYLFKNIFVAAENMKFAFHFLNRKNIAKISMQKENQFNCITVQKFIWK